MALQLPHPAPPGSSPAHSRAHRLWQAGQSHAQREHWPLAARSFEEAAALHGDTAYALAATHALIKAGRAADAVRRARAIRARDPRAGLAYTLESHALLGLGRAEESVETLRTLPADVQRDADHHVSLAVSLQRSRRHEEAIRSFFDALALKMDDALSHFRLGMSFKELGMKAEAAECVRTAVVLGPRQQRAGGAGAARLPRARGVPLGRRRRRDDRPARAVRALPDDTPVETGPFPHAVLVDDPLEQLKVARHYALHVAQLHRPLPRRVARAHGGRLRIGYLSADFHIHATSQLMAQMLECHDRSAFEVTLLSSGKDDNSAMRQRMVAASERFEDLHGQGFDAIARRARELEIDILVDLKGATHDTLMPVLAQRPAPLQVTWLGFPGTTGAPYIDYLIGDDGRDAARRRGALQREDRADAALLPAERRAAGCCPRRRRAPPSAWPTTRSCCAPSISRTRSPAEVFATWCDLLQRAAGIGAVAAAMERQRAAVADRGGARAGHRCRPARLRAGAAAGGSPRPAGLRRPVPRRLAVQRAHDGGRGALGRRSGRHRAGPHLRPARRRQPASHDRPRRAGRGDVAAYSALVVALAGDAPRRAALRAELAARRTTTPLFDGAAFARDIESLYRRMWQRAVTGQAPAHLPAERAARVD